MRPVLAFSCKLIALLLLNHLFQQSLSAQELIGYNYNNYIGVNGATSNPASIAASRYKIHVNLITANAYAGSNAYEFNSKKFFGFKFNNWKEGQDYRKIEKNEVKSEWSNVDILGPSVMINLDKKSAIAFTTRFRTLENVSNVSNNSFSLVGKPLPGIYGVDFNEENVRAKASSFADAGITYATVIKDKGNSFIKAGVTLKYIQGISSAYLKIDSLNVNIKDVKSLETLNGKGTLLYAGNIDQFSKDGQDMEIAREISMRNGTVGMDLGFVYEHRSDKFKPVEGSIRSKYQAIPYDFRFSLAVTDFAFAPIRYDAGKESGNYMLSADNVKKDTFRFKDQQNVEEYLQNLQFTNLLDKQSSADEFNVPLPTNFRANIDWHISKYFFVNADALISLHGANSDKTGANYISTFNITPRYESQWLSIYSPVSVNVYDEFNWGAGLRIGPLFVGSGSVLSNALKSNFRNIDAHVGLSVPIYQGQRVKKQKPAPVSEPFLPTNKAVLPETESYSLAVIKVEPAHEPHTALTVEIPEVKEEVKKTAEKAASRLFFLSGSAIISTQSFNSLDELATVLKDDESLLLAIEGHTDNVGNDMSNRKLSFQRADAARLYLVKKGIHSNRISAYGFGSTMPVSSNDTGEGRAQNRRIVLRVRNQ